MSSVEERVQILEMIESGTITPEEGLRLLEALGSDQEIVIDSEVLGQGEGDVISKPELENMRKWKRWWMVPLWIGVGIIVLSGFLMFSAWSANGIGFWFFFTWIPFFLGVGVLALAWGSRTSPWLHLRVHQKPGQKPERIALSFPLPLLLTAWILRTFGRWIPNLDATGLDEVIMALRENTDEDTPLIINVDEGEDGERVQVYIG